MCDWTSWASLHDLTWCITPALLSAVQTTKDSGGKKINHKDIAWQKQNRVLLLLCDSLNLRAWFAEKSEGIFPSTWNETMKWIMQWVVLHDTVSHGLLGMPAGWKRHWDFHWILALLRKKSLTSVVSTAFNRVTWSLVLWMPRISSSIPLPVQTEKKKKEKSLDLLPSLSFLTYLQRITALKTHVLQKGRQQLTAFEIRAALSYASLRNTCRFEGLCRIYTAEPCLQDHHCEKKKNNGQEFPGNSSLWWLADIVLNYRLWSPDLQPEFQLQC